MKIWFDRILAGLRWAGEKLVAFVKFALAKLKVVFDTVYDPPPRTIRFWFWSFAAVAAVCWITFAFVNSWYYRPTAQYFAEFSHTWLGDDGDVVLPEHEEPVPAVALPAIEVPTVDVVCHDMSDTPQCEPVQKPSEKSTEGTQIEAEANSIPPPAAKSPVGYKAKKSPTGYKRRKHQPYVTYWGY